MQDEVISQAIASDRNLLKKSEDALAKRNLTKEDRRFHLDRVARCTRRIKHFSTR